MHAIGTWLSSTDSKGWLSLVGVIVGWLLGQGTAIARDWRSSRKFQAGLLTELEDIRDELRRVTLFYARQLQVLGLRGIEPTYPSPIHNLFFTHYYKDVFGKLNREQRLSYQTTHSAIESLNRGGEELGQYLAGLRDRKTRMPPAGDLDDWGNRVKVLYMAARTATWHVDYHLTNPKHPSLDLLGPTHENFLKYQETVGHEVEKITADAKSLKPEDFAKIYDERAFARPMQTTVWPAWYKRLGSAIKALIATRALRR